MFTNKIKRKKEIDSELSVASSVSSNNKAKNIKIVKKIIYGLALLLIILCVIRVPYVGQFFDAVFFSFIFGWAKYILYGYAIFYLSIKIIDVKKKPLHSKRYFLFALIITFFFSMLLGGVQILVFGDKYNISNYVNQIWKDQMWNMKNFWFYGSSKYIDGGLIGAILSSISGIFIIFLAIVAFICTFFVFFPTQRKKVVEKLLRRASAKYGDANISQQFDLNNSKEDKNNLELISTNKQKNFSLKDSYMKNDVNAKSLKNGIEKFLEENKINFSDIQVDEDDSLVTFKFNIDETQMKKFEEIKNNFETVFHKIQYKITWIDTTVLIKVDKYSKQINSTLALYMSGIAVHDYDFTLCLSENNQPIILNLLTNNIIGLSANSYQEYTYSFINAIIAYLSVNYKKDMLEIVCLSPIPIEQQILRSQNSSKNIIENYTNLKKYFMDLFDEVKAKEKILQQNQVTTIDEYNKLANADRNFNFKVIILDNINLIADKDEALFEKILKLMEQAKRYNLAFILVDNSKSGVTFQKIPYHMILSLDVEQSNKEYLMTSSNSLIKLYVPKKKQKYMVRIPRVNKNELTIISNKLASLFNQYNE